MAPPPDGVADADAIIEQLWRTSTEEILAIDPATENWKSQVLPLARIKKIMKSEEGILSDMEKEKSGSGDEPSSASTGGQRFMIAGEAPVLLGKACELFVREVTMRAWRHTERNRRRTLQKQDVHAAVGESEVYDFLIDIVPRVTPTTGGKSYSSTDPPAPSSVPPSAETAAAAQVPPPVGAEGSEAPAAMTIADAEMRLAHLQHMHNQYTVMHRQAQAGAGPPMPPQQPVMNPYHMQMPPEQAAAQWPGQVTRVQQQHSVPPASDEQQGGPATSTKEEPT